MAGLFGTARRYISDATSKLRSKSDPLSDLGEGLDDIGAPRGRSYTSGGTSEVRPNTPGNFKTLNTPTSMSRLGLAGRGLASAGYGAAAVNGAVNGSAGDAISNTGMMAAPFAGPVGAAAIGADLVVRGLSGGQSGITDWPKLFMPSTPETEGPALKTMKAQTIQNPSANPNLAQHMGLRTPTFPDPAQAQPDIRTRGVIAPSETVLSAGTPTNPQLAQQTPRPAFGDGVAAGDLVGLARSAVAIREANREDAFNREQDKLRLGHRQADIEEFNKAGALGLRRDELRRQAMNDQVTQRATADTRLQKRYDDMFQTATVDDKGKVVQAPDKVKQEQFKQFIYASDPVFQNSGQDPAVLLADIVAQKGDKYLTNMRAEFDVAQKVNETQTRKGLGGRVTGGPDAAQEVGDASLSDVFNRGLPVKDYLWSNLPFTDPNVVRTKGGRAALTSDVIGNDLDREEAVRRQLGLRR